MKLSFDWLSDYVDLDGVKVEEVRDALTMGAFEVEEVRPVCPVAITGPVVVGEILEIYPHPNANKIRLTKTRSRLAQNRWRLSAAQRILKSDNAFP